MPDFDEIWEQLPKAQQQKMVAMVLNYPNNPTGAMASEAYLEKTLRFADKHNLLVLSDMAYAEYGYFDPQGQLHRPPSVLQIAQKMGLSHRVMEFWTMSKLGLSGDRVGFAISGSNDRIAELSHFRGFVNAANIPKYIEVAVAQFLNDPVRMDQFVLAQNKRYWEKWHTMDAAMQNINWPTARPEGSHFAPFYYYTPLPSPDRSHIHGSREMALRLLKEAGVLSIPSDDFKVDGSMRFALTQPLAGVQEALHRMKTTGFDFSSI